MKILKKNKNISTGVFLLPKEQLIKIDDTKKIPLKKMLEIEMS